MKVLLVHGYYRSNAPSGEGRVFEEERDLLMRRGIEVETFTRDSNQMISRFGAAAPWVAAGSTPWNPLASRALRIKIQEFKPDVVHVHNVFPWISPGIFHNIPAGTASVLTLHNYRILCPAATPARAGRICTECIDQRSSVPALRHGCYRDSRLATLPLALSVSLHRWLGTWSKKVDALIALTDFQRDVLIKGGLPAARIHVKPNFIAGNPKVTTWTERDDYALFVGRLSAEKGLSTLIKAWRIGGEAAPRLLIVGDGPLRNQLQSSLQGLRVQMLGRLNHQETQHLMAKARLLMVPSEWFEGFALVLLEAFSHGTPAAVSNLGPLPLIAPAGECGIIFEPYNPEDLMRNVLQAWHSPGLLERLGKGARAAFERQFTATANFTQLITIYERALEVARRA